ncbi:hypothetical protein [Rhodoferax sp.]
MELSSNNVRDLPEWASFMQPVNLQIHKDAWALLHMILRDQTQGRTSPKQHSRMHTLRAFTNLLFMQSSREDKNAFDLFDAVKSVRWDSPCENNPEFMAYYAAWRKVHPYSPGDTPPVSFESMSRIKQFEAGLGGIA